MGPRFDKLQVDANGNLTVEGPFETYGELIGDVAVRFLIIGKDRTTIDSTTNVSADQPATFSSDPGASTASSVLVTSGTFSATVPDSDFVAGDDVRAIGLAVAVKKAEHPNPPGFETFTWCVNLKVTSATAAA
jgi:hypothetical protein